MSNWEYKAISSGRGGFATPALLEKFPNAEIEIGVLRGLCSYYAEVGGVLVAYEGNLRA